MDRGGGTKRSKVWLHFTRESGDRAKCNTCERLISCRPAGCTSNLTRHLKQHGVRGGGEGTVFDVLRSQTPSSSSSSTTTAEPEEKTERKRPNKEKHEAEPTERKRLSKEKNEECHRAVTKFVVKGLHPFSVVESTSFRELTRTLNPNYTPPSRDILSHHLIPAWYKVEKSNVVSELGDVGKVAITSDGWTSMTQDHYLTVTAHYVIEGKMRQKVLKTKPVYKSQTGPAVSEDISDILQEFGIMNKIVAVTVDNATNVNVAIKKRLRFIKLPCLAHTLNLGAQSAQSVAAVAKWTAKIRDVVVWMKRSSLAKILLKEKQQNLNLPQRALILDVRTRWDSPYKMMERFLEQRPAIQAAFHDQRLKKSMERDRLPRLTEEDFRKAEEFVHVMRVLYTSTLCVSSEQSPTSCAAHILPTLQKLRTHFAVREDDTAFASVLKQAVWGSVWQPYRSDDVRAFLEEAAVLDPRFKDSVEDGAVWERLRDKMAAGGGGKPAEREQPRENSRMEEEEGERAEEEEELFPYEDDVSGRTTAVRLQTEMELTAYRETPPTAPSVDPAAWWWNNRTTFPSLWQLASSYLCVQASSTPSERVFSTAGDNICAERSRIQAEKADMLIFLNKNCC